MLNASVGLQRVLARLRLTRIDRAPASVRFHRRSLAAARDLRVRASSLAATAQVAPARAAEAAAPVRRSLSSRVGRDALLPIVVVLIVAFASIASWLPGLPARGAIGGPTGDGPGPRLALRGADSASDGARSDVGSDGSEGSAAPSPLDAPPQLRRVDPDAMAITGDAGSGSIGGPFLADGTLLKPIAVTTTIADGRDLLRSYTVRQGDTLAAIAKRFGVSLMSVVWANDLKSTQLKVGAKLVIPPFNGVVLTVNEGDTLDGLAKEYEVDADRVYEVNGLEDPVLIAGQTLILPGAVGDPLPTPKPPATKSSGGGGTTVRPPTTYAGGTMAWPVVGGNNYISQYFHTGHYGLDIAADYGSKVRAGAAGTVTFAGWKSNGGGYQVWIAHGSGLYTTYNHMSGVSVGSGQRVAKGQQVGRVGQSGNATGPHLHFEVWRGPIWNGGSRVNPLRYL